MSLAELFKSSKSEAQEKSYKMNEDEQELQNLNSKVPAPNITDRLRRLFQRRKTTENEVTEAYGGDQPRQEKSKQELAQLRNQMMKTKFSSRKSEMSLNSSALPLMTQVNEVNETQETQDGNTSLIFMTDASNIKRLNSTEIDLERLATGTKAVMDRK
jgi:hypothetical protein